jgi:uncharacterized protein (TIGR02996 family)
MRTFEYHGAKSHKYWAIDVHGNGLIVTHGNVGTPGQTQTKPFASAEKAQAEAEKLVREKLKKGYVETTPVAAVSQAEAFERALAADPHDLAGWCAYADYLNEQGDPRGEFMQIQIALEDESLARAKRDALKKKEAKLLKKHERDWLGPLAAITVDAEPVPYWGRGKKAKKRAPVARQFTRGWLSRLEFHHLTVDQARALTKAPQARLLRELVVEQVEQTEAPPAGTTPPHRFVDSWYEPGSDVPANIDPLDGPALYALSRCPHLASVRVFRLGEGVVQTDGRDEEQNYNCVTPGQLAHHVVTQMPNLEELYLLAHRVDADKIFALPMPNLRILQLYHSYSYPLDKLAANKSLANLTTLLCLPHAQEYGDQPYIRLPQLKAVCRSPYLTGLTHLRLRLTDFGDQGAKEIVESGILKRLKILDLQGGCITDEGARLLAACPYLKNLDFLDLKGNSLTEAGEQAIAATGVKADVSVGTRVFWGDIE